MQFQLDNHIINAYKSFSRDYQFDLQVYLNAINEYDTVIELGLGSGRLCSHWLSCGKKVIGIETEKLFLNYIKQEYAFSIGTGFLKLVNSISELDVQNNNSILLAPFNLIFHLPDLDVFSLIAKTAFSKGIKAIVFDFDKLSDKEISEIKYINKRIIGNYIELATLKKNNILKIDWIIKSTNQIIYSFYIYMYSYQDVMDYLGSNFGEKCISEMKCLQDQHGTDISFIKINESNETI